MGHAFKQIARINLMRDMFVGRMAECLRRAGQTEDASWLTRHWQRLVTVVKRRTGIESKATCY
jgi:hypothetical protein